MVKVFMIRYIYSVLQKFPDNMVETESTPAADHLFKLHNESETQYLPEDQSQTFYHTVSQLLFMISVSLRDI